MNVSKVYSRDMHAGAQKFTSSPIVRKGIPFANTRAIRDVMTEKTENKITWWCTAILDFSSAEEAPKRNTREPTMMSE